MSDKDVRWKQRFQNFEKAYFRLKQSLEKDNLNELERNGLIQRFEFTIELCWNTLKDYLTYQGVQFKPTPKETIRQAYKSEVILDAQILIDALDLRNELSHDYSEEKFEAAEVEIKQTIFPEISKVYSFFKDLPGSSQTDIFDD